MTRTAGAKRSIEIDDDITFQRKDWTFQFIGRIIWTIALLVGLSGLLGSGPLSNAKQRTADGTLQAEYQRIDRYDSPSDLRILVSGAYAKAGDLAVSLNKDFVDRSKIQRIDPEPDSTDLTGDRHIYHFKTLGSNNMTINFKYENNSIGMTPLVVQIENGPQLKVNSFTLP